MGEGQPKATMPIPEAKKILDHTPLNLAANQIADYAEQGLALTKRPNLEKLHRLERSDGFLSPEDKKQLNAERDRQIIRTGVVRSRRPIVELLKLKAWSPFFQFILP